jgi:hypothetical protein
MRPLAAWLTLLAIVLAGCQGRPAPEAVLAAVLRAPVVFRWDDAAWPSGERQRGGVAFVERAGRIHSVAWPDAVGGRKWPAVYGVGRREGLRLVVEYRTLVPDPAHEFYWAECRFELTDDLQAFRCEYTQRTMPQSTELTPGVSLGTRDPVPDTDAYLERLARRMGAGG